MIRSCLDCPESLERKHFNTKRCEPCRKAYRLFCGARDNKKYRTSEQGKKAGQKYAQTPKAKYNSQKQHCKARGIGFYLTFDEWWNLWEPYFSNRGKWAENMVMCRENDMGDYELGNVRIDTASSNSLERHRLYGHTLKTTTQ